MSDAAFNGPLIQGGPNRPESDCHRVYARPLEALEHEISRYIRDVGARGPRAPQRRTSGKADRVDTEKLVSALCWAAWAALGLVGLRVVWYLWVMPW